MVSPNLLLIALPIVAVFGIAFWLMIFLNTYRHFPKMNPEERLRKSIVDTTTITIILIGIVYLFLWFILQNFIN
jgi:heme/copper-type cytochrome/quinol oxidase subunit 2